MLRLPRSAPARIAAATIALTSASCGVTGRTDATSVDLLVGANAGREVEPAAGGGMTFDRSDGSTVTLTRAYVTTFTMTYGGWLDGVDPGADEAAALVLAQVAGNLSVGAGGEPPAHP
jgi:hypothetical protein